MTIPKYLSLLMVLLHSNDVMAGGLGASAGFLGFGVSSDYTYRGRFVPTGTRYAFAEVSTLGISTSILLQSDPESSGLLSELSVAYSYTFGFVDADIGMAYTELPSQIRSESTQDFFLEVRGNPEWGGALFLDIVPSFRQSFNLKSEGGNFTELRFEKELWHEHPRALLRPYLEIGAGDFYTDSWRLNHVELGANLAWQFSNQTVLSPYYSVTRPLNGLRKTLGETNSETRYGLQLEYRF